MESSKITQRQKALKLIEQWIRESETNNLKEGRQKEDETNRESNPT
ncbi:hypothetical protein [Oceanobacillus kimchii]